MSSNSCHVSGNLTRDPELRFVDSGKAVTNISIAHNRRWLKGDEQQEETSFFDVVCWGQLAENVAENFHKGSPVTVVGRLQQRSYEKDGNKRNIVEIVADDVATSQRFGTRDDS